MNTLLTAQLKHDFAEPPEHPFEEQIDAAQECEDKWGIVTKAFKERWPEARRARAIEEAFAAAAVFGDMDG